MGRPAQETDLRVVLLGGAANAISVARSLGRRGVEVFALVQPDEHLRHSRYATWIPLGDELEFAAACERFLLSPRSDHLRGALLMACGDEGIEIMIRNWAALSERFLLEEGDREVRRRLLDKLLTYEAARAAGVPTPRFWHLGSLAELDRVIDDLPLPILVKPLLRYRFEQLYDRKYFRADEPAALRRVFEEITSQGIEVVLVEFIPGGDEDLRTYYAYHDETGAPLLRFTKRSLRRWPMNMGLATFHVSTWDPEVAELGARLFRAVGLRGQCNVEFKRDRRDGRLKIIECNPRYSGANCLLVACGIDLAAITYDRALSRPVAPIPSYRVGLTAWWPVEDYHAFEDLRRLGRLSWLGWLRSLARPHVLPYFRFGDAKPTLIHEWQRARRVAGRLGRRLGGAGAAPARGDGRAPLVVEDGDR